MDSEFLLQYRSMNPEHLLDDEIEYELAIRQVEFNSGESRDAKKRKLRNVLKEQREKNNFRTSLPETQEMCEEEFMQVSEKLTKVREKLENSRMKKAEIPVFKTRLIHLYFRVFRLRGKFNTKVLEATALKMLKDHFTFLSNDPSARKQTAEMLRQELSRLSVLNEESEPEEMITGNEDDSESVKELGEEEEEEVRNTSTPKQKRKNRKTEKKKDKSEKDTEKATDALLMKLIQHVDSYIETKLSSLDGGSKKDVSSSEDDLSEQESHGVGKKQKSVDKKNEKKKKMNRRQKGKKDDKKQRKDSSSENESVSSESSSEEETGRSKTLKRRPRSVSEWKMKYDGKDEGKRLNKFIAEVEFMAEAEGIRKRELFSEAIHLFSGEARTWYMEGKKNQEFRSWNELVAELKLEFQPPDMDFHYEQQAAQRRQKRSERFLDYYNAVMEIFRFMAVPPSEQRMFEIVFRNLRSDYKNVLVVKGVRTLKALKQWGRKLDSVNMWMYRTKENETAPKAAQVHEVNRVPYRQGEKTERKEWKPNPSAGNKYRSNEKPTSTMTNADGPKKPETRPPPRKEEVEGESVSGSVAQRVAQYQVPDKLVCFNCRGKYHHFSACLLEKAVFCTTCGFHDYTSKNCPYCAKNGRTSA